MSSSQGKVRNEYGLDWVWQDEASGVSGHWKHSAGDSEFMIFPSEEAGGTWNIYKDGELLRRIYLDDAEAEAFETVANVLRPRPTEPIPQVSPPPAKFLQDRTCPMCGHYMIKLACTYKCNNCGESVGIE